MHEGKSEYPAAVLAAAEEALDNLLCNCTESCGAHEGLRKASIEEIAKTILAERQRIASDICNREGFMTFTSGSENYVKIKFKTMKEMHGFQDALVSLSKWKLPSPPVLHRGEMNHD